MLVTWIKRKYEIQWVQSVREDLGRFVCQLRGGADKEIGELVAVATIFKLWLTDEGLLPSSALELADPGDDTCSIIDATLVRLHRKLQKTDRLLDAAGVAVWLLTTRALGCGEARELGREMWGELRRGFAYAEQSLAELETITRVPAEAWQAYNFIPPDLEPVGGRECTVSQAACGDPKRERSQERLIAIVHEYGLPVADESNNVHVAAAVAAHVTRTAIVDCGWEPKYLSHEQKFVAMVAFLIAANHCSRLAGVEFEETSAITCMELFLPVDSLAVGWVLGQAAEKHKRMVVGHPADQELIRSVGNGIAEWIDERNEIGLRRLTGFLKGMVSTPITSRSAEQSE